MTYGRSSWKSELITEGKRTVTWFAYVWKISPCGKVLGKVYYECVSNTLLKNVYTSILQRKKKVLRGQS